MSDKLYYKVPEFMLSLEHIKKHCRIFMEPYRPGVLFGTIEQQYAGFYLVGRTLYKASNPDNSCTYVDIFSGESIHGEPSSQHHQFNSSSEPLKTSLARCECGSDAARLPTHSTWCPKHARNER